MLRQKTDTRHSRTRATHSRAPATIGGSVWLANGAGLRGRDFHADRLEHNIKVASGAKPCANGGAVRVVRPEVVQYQRFLVEQRFDVDKFPGPAMFVKDSPAHREKIRP